MRRRYNRKNRFWGRPLREGGARCHVFAIDVSNHGLKLQVVRQEATICCRASQCILHTHTSPIPLTESSMLPESRSIGEGNPQLGSIDHQSAQICCLYASLLVQGKSWTSSSRPVTWNRSFCIYFMYYLPIRAILLPSAMAGRCFISFCIARGPEHVVSDRYLSQSGTSASIQAKERTL